MSERDMQRLLELVERVLGREWIDAANWLRSLPDNSVDAIEARLIAHDYAGLIVEVETAAKTFAAATHAQFERAGRVEAKWLDKQPALKEKLIRFDAKNEFAIHEAQANELKNVQGLTLETRANIQAVMVEMQHENPRVQARAIRDSIGLTDQQAKWVRSYEVDIRAGRYTKALGRELRDKRSDKLLRRAKKDGLTESQITAIVERYRKKQLKYRAEMIARTESMKNAHGGSEEAFRQAIERGDIEASDVVTEWHPGPITKHARKDHRSASLLAQRPGWNEPFSMPSSGAKMRYPGDDDLGAGADDIVHCHCTVSRTLAA